MPEASEEQQKALMEKLKNMSPEELREFQKKQCIFCQIASKKMEGKVVYEDDKSIAILDINPAAVGHVLLLPKEHYAIMPQIPEDQIEHLGIVSKKLSLAVLKGLKVQGTTLFVANGLAAGQRAQHFMIHIIPRKEGDNIGLAIPQRQIKEEALLKLHEVVQNKVNEIFGIKKKVVVGAQKQSVFGTLKSEDFDGKKTKGERLYEENEEKEEHEAEENVGEEEEEEEQKVKVERKPTKKKFSKKKKKEKEGADEGASLDDIARLFT